MDNIDADEVVVVNLIVSMIADVVDIDVDMSVMVVVADVSNTVVVVDIHVVVVGHVLGTDIPVVEHNVQAQQQY